jgi:hypothetical protein
VVVGEYSRTGVEWYTAYDAKVVANDNQLQREEIWISRGLGSRLFHREADEIFQKQQRIENFLKQIPSDVDLADLPGGQAIPGVEAIAAAVDCMCEVKGVRVPKATKILHKKRPNLIPVFDSRVGLYYAARLRNPKFDVDVDDIWSLLESFHHDLVAVAGEVRNLKRELDAINVRLTNTRILDHLIWARLHERNFE